MGVRPVSVEDRFWPKVQKSEGCWLWTAGTTGAGYGKISVRLGVNQHRIVGAHCVSYAIHKGDVPEGMEVCHFCDNPPCVNPAHLFLGTRLTNMQDMVRKGRYNPNRVHHKNCKPMPGQSNGRAIATDDDVRKMRSLPRAEAIGFAVALGMSERQAKKILRGQAWRHIL